MASKIRVLKEHTINKIAAGEVIENPASVIKELVENSIDAGATEIAIEVRGGGRQLIRIVDNGSGMNRDDCLLCLERHATSKIREVEEIHSIETMGFRGEAIPSIASISKFTLISSEEASEGTMIIVEGGKILQCSAAVRSRGTTIEVKSLFFNVPVRRKFQKSPAHDTNEIVKIVSSLSLSHPQIAFQLVSDQKSLISVYSDPTQLPSDALRERVKQILGEDFLNSTCFVQQEQEEFKLMGLIGQPFYTRHNRTGQFLFINHRAISSPLVGFAVKEGYSTMLPSNRHPVYVLHLTIPGSMVDVNVHPQKREVRLRQEQSLKEMIRQAIQKSLHMESSLSLPSFEDPFVPAPIPSFKNASYFIDFPVEPKQQPENPFSFIRPVVNTIETPTIRQKISSPAPTLPVPSLLANATSNVRVIGTLKDYLLVDGAHLADRAPSGGLGLLDQRAAYARVLFERLQQRGAAEKVEELQSLLIPISIETTPLETSILVQHLEEFNRYGIGIRQTGPHIFHVDSIATHLFANVDLSSFIKGIVHEIQADPLHSPFAKDREKKLAWKVSLESRHYNKRLTIEEGQRLIDQLLRCEMPYQCPYGRPTIAFITLDEIAKKFI